VQTRATAVDDNSVTPPDRTASAPARRPPDWKSVEDCLGLLARAVQQFHTYPATSPLCVSAIDACQRAFSGLAARDQVTCRVTPSELIVDHVPTGRGAQVGHELARRLHRASVASVAFDRSLTARELARFCEDLLRCGERAGSGLTLLERLSEHGIERITIEMAGTPAVLEVPAPSPVILEHARREHTRFDEQMARGGAINHLYPPQKGWVRLDAAAAPPAVSLLDLAVLADDPATFASMLLRLTNDDEQGVSPGAALEKKYSDVAMVVSALDPAASRRMLSKLARAVLDLEPASRQALLRRTVLPGLLDGRIDGAILREFPDVELSESLCLLLDLETAAPELLMTALSRLDLSPERHSAMLPLLDARLKERESAASDEQRQTTLTRHARELVRIDGGAGKTFAEFAAFDLSVDADAALALQHIRTAVPTTDVTADQLTCLWHLISLEPNPDTVARFLERSFCLLGALEAAGRGEELPAWLTNYRELSQRLWEARPDVATVITLQLAAFCTPQRAAWIADLALCEPGGRAAAAAMVVALGPAVVAPLVDVLERGSDHAEARGDGRTAQNRSRAAAQLLIDHAAALAPAAAPLLDRCSFVAQRTLLRVLGCAGRGYERSIAPHVASRDDTTAREALRALARIGTPDAAAIVVGAIEQQRGALSVAAEETLWHFPAAEAQRQTRDLLGRRDFTVRHPQASERLLDRAARAGAAGLEPVLQSLAPLRFRIWSPAVARVARKAHGMLSKE
jgi:hypothetical protein